MVVHSFVENPETWAQDEQVYALSFRYVSASMSAVSQTLNSEHTVGGVEDFGVMSLSLYIKYRLIWSTTGVTLGTVQGMIREAKL
jgi:hypothetical protein